MSDYTNNSSQYNVFSEQSDDKNDEDVENVKTLDVIEEEEVEEQEQEEVEEEEEEEEVEEEVVEIENQVQNDDYDDFEEDFEEEVEEEVEEKDDTEEDEKNKYEIDDTEQNYSDDSEQEDEETLENLNLEFSLNKTIVDISKDEEKNIKNEENEKLNNILLYIGKCLKKMKNYRVIGGRAIQNWLNPHSIGLTTEEKNFIKTNYWDIELEGNSEEAKNFIRKIKHKLVKKFKENFTLRISDYSNIAGSSLVYEIGIEEEKTTNWIVNVYIVKEIDETKSIIIDGIIYPKLSVLLKSINVLLDQTNNRKITRKLIVEKALKDIYLFNEDIYNKIKTECDRKGNENITGLNLDCKSLIFSAENENSVESELVNQLKKMEEFEEFAKSKEYLEITNSKYPEAFKALQTNKLPKNPDEKQTTDLVFGLSFFYNQKLLDELLNKIINNLKKEYFEVFFNENIDKVNFEYICLNKNIPESFFREHIKKIDYKSFMNLCTNSNISSDFFEENITEVNWMRLSENSNMPVEFFEKYIDKVNIYSLCENTNLPEEFFDRHIKKVDWRSLCKNTNLSEAFFEKYILQGCRIDWEVLCGNTNLSEAFFERHINQVKWVSLCRNTNISEDFFKKYLNKIRWEMLCQNTNISEKFFRNNLPKFYKELCKNSNLSEYFFSEHINEIDWTSLCKNPNISESFFQNYLDIRNFPFNVLCKNPNMSEEFFERNLHRLSPTDWRELCENISMSESFFERHFLTGAPLDWDKLCQNKNMSSKFFEKFSDKISWSYLCLNDFKVEKEKILPYADRYPFQHILKMHIMKTSKV